MDDLLAFAEWVICVIYLPNQSAAYISVRSLPSFGLYSAKQVAGFRRSYSYPRRDLRSAISENSSRITNVTGEYDLCSHPFNNFEL
jgi:hypothetical protein